jgi:hypothetical protein
VSEGGAEQARERERERGKVRAERERERDREREKAPQALAYHNSMFNKHNHLQFESIEDNFARNFSTKTVVEIVQDSIEMILVVATPGEIVL